MPDARVTEATYHIAGEGFTGEHASASHQTTSATINSNAGAARELATSIDFVSGPLDPGVWEAVFVNKADPGGAAIDSALLVAHGATAAEATPTAASAFMSSAAASVEAVVVYRFIVPKNIQYIGFRSAAAAADISFSLRRVHGTL